MPEFFQTIMGRKFFEADFPRLVRAVEALAKKLPDPATVTTPAPGSCRFLVIEMWPSPEEARIIIDGESEKGHNCIFTSREAAQAEADQCQKGIVLELPVTR